MNGSLFPGRSGNAGALGSLPIPASERNGGPIAQQLIRSASIYVLEKRMIAAGRDPAVLSRSPDDWGDVGPELDRWIAETAASLAAATVAAIAVIDFEAVIIDGAFPTEVRRRIVVETAARSRPSTARGSRRSACLKEPSAPARARSGAPACRSLRASRATAKCSSRTGYEPDRIALNSGFSER